MDSETPTAMDGQVTSVRSPDEVAVPRDRALEEANKEIVRRVEEAWQAEDFDALQELLAPDMETNASVPFLPPGLEGWKMAHLQFRDALPDRKVTIEEMVAEGDRVAIRCRLRGTNTGGLPWAGAEGNGREVDMQWLGIYRIRDGKVVEHFAINDMMTLTHQVGAPDSLVDRRVRRGGWPLLS